MCISKQHAYRHIHTDTEEKTGVLMGYLTPGCASEKSFIFIPVLS